MTLPPDPNYIPQYQSPMDQPRTSGASIASLVMGIPGLCIPLLGIGAIICGAIGMNKTRDPRVGGRALAIAGLILGIAGTVFSTGLVALQLSILLPSLNRARETANRVKCATDMRQIGQAILLYSNDNNTYFPPDLEALEKTQSLSPNVFVCPSSNDTNSPDGKLTSGHLSYVYVGKGMTNSTSPEAIVLYEPLSNHSNDGMNVLFADGHIEFISRPTAQKMLNEINSGHNPARPDHLR